MLTFALVSLLAATPKVGEVAPDFTVSSVDGVELKLSAMVEKGAVVLAFFPKAFTPGCTAELKAYVTQYDTIRAAGGDVIVASTDDIITAKKFRDSLKAPYHFVGDFKQELVKAYDVKAFILPIARRITFVIGKDRKVLAVQEGDDAIDASRATAACNAHAQKAVQLVTQDGGAAVTPVP